MSSALKYFGNSRYALLVWTEGEREREREGGRSSDKLLRAADRHQSSHLIALCDDEKPTEILHGVYQIVYQIPDTWLVARFREHRNIKCVRVACDSLAV